MFRKPSRDLSPSQQEEGLLIKDVGLPARQTFVASPGLPIQLLQFVCMMGLVGAVGLLLSSFSIIEPSSHNPFVVNYDTIQGTVGLLGLLTSVSGGLPPDPCQVKEGIFSPTTPLGVDAEKAFQIETTCLSAYKNKLESFLSPKSSMTSDTKLLQQSLRQTWVRSPFRQYQRPITRPIPPKIHWNGSLDPSWKTLNPDFSLALAAEVNLETDSTGEETSHVEVNLMGSEKKNHSFTLSPLKTWNLEKTPESIKYLEVYKQGGFFVGSNLICQKSIEAWTKHNDSEAGDDGRWVRGTAVHPGGRVMTTTEEPSVILGIEQQAKDTETDWKSKMSRPVTISRQVLGFSAYHPIIIDTLRRLVTTRIDETSALTDATIEYLSTMTQGGFHWTELRNLPLQGLRLGDVLILSNQTFSQYVYQNSAIKL